MKNIIKIIGLAVSLTASTAFAVPTLYFDGLLDYTSTGDLSIEATLINSSDVTMPDLASSSLTLGAVFDSVVDLGTHTAGLFNGISGDDLMISDSSGSLLTGEFSQLYMIGGNGNNYGTLRGELSATGGSLSSFFSSSDLIALEFNLGTVFSTKMFSDSFSGHVNGTVKGSQPVPEPGVLALLGVGLLLTGVARKARKA